MHTMKHSLINIQGITPPECYPTNLNPLESLFISENDILALKPNQPALFDLVDVLFSLHIQQIDYKRTPAGNYYYIKIIKKVKILYESGNKHSVHCSYHEIPYSYTQKGPSPNHIHDIFIGIQDISASLLNNRQIVVQTVLVSSPVHYHSVHDDTPRNQTYQEQRNTYQPPYPNYTPAFENQVEDISYEEKEDDLPCDEECEPENIHPSIPPFSTVHIEESPPPPKPKPKEEKYIYEEQTDSQSFPTYSSSYQRPTLEMTIQQRNRRRFNQ